PHRELEILAAAIVHVERRRLRDAESRRALQRERGDDLPVLPRGRNRVVGDERRPRPRRAAPQRESEQRGARDPSAGGHAHDLPDTRCQRHPPNLPHERRWLLASGEREGWAAERAATARRFLTVP